MFIERSPDSIRKGEMPQEEWVVDDRLPNFENKQTRAFSITVGDKKVNMYHSNTLIMCYSGQFTHMTHVVVFGKRDEEPFYLFAHPKSEENGHEWLNEKIETLIAESYTVAYPADQPPPHVMEEYLSMLRGKESLDSVLERIIDFGEGQEQGAG